MKLKRGEKKSLGMVSSLLYLSGVGLWVLSRLVRVASPLGEQHHPLELWLRTAHGATSYLALLALGYLIKSHVLPGWAARRRVVSGVGMLTVLALLLLTALIILYGSENPLRDGAITVHWVAGLLTPAYVCLHAVNRIREGNERKEKEARRLPCGRPAPDWQEASHSHRHSEDRLAGLERKLERHVRAQRLNRSDSRRKVLAALCHFPAHFTASQLIAAVGKAYPSVGSATVYRSLQVFTTAGILRETFSTGSGEKVFEVSHHTTTITSCASTATRFSSSGRRASSASRPRFWGSWSSKRPATAT